MSRLRVGGEWRNTLCRFLLSLTLVFIVQWTNTVRWCGLLPRPRFHYLFVTSEYFSHFSLSYSCSCDCCLWNAANSNNKVDIIMGRLSFLQNIHLNLQESGNLSSDQFDIPGLVSLLAMYLYKAFLFVFFFFFFFGITSTMFASSVAWLLQMEDLWRKRKSVYLWVTVSVFGVAL